MRFRWYVVAIAIVVVGWLGAVAHSAGAWDVVRESAVTPVGRDFDAKGRHVGVLTDLPQPERGITCEAVGPGKDQTTPIDPAPVDVSVDSDGTRWYLIALMEDGRDGMDVTCTPADENSDSAVYGYQVISELNDRAATTRLLSIVSLVAGIALAGWTAWKRRWRSVEA